MPSEKKNRAFFHFLGDENLQRKSGRIGQLFPSGIIIKKRRLFHLFRK